jgi:hypothetical protein
LRVIVVPRLNKLSFALGSIAVTSILFTLALFPLIEEVPSRRIQTFPVFNPNLIPGALQSVPLELDAVDKPGEATNIADFSLDDRRILGRASAIALSFATYQQHVFVERIQLVFFENDCEFVAEINRIIEDNETIWLTRRGNCNFDPGIASDATAKIEVYAKSKPRIAIWSIKENDRSADLRFASIGSSQGQRLFPAGKIQLTEGAESAQRWRLLQCVWGEASGAATSLIFVAAACVLLGAVGLLAALGRTLNALASGSMAFGIALAYVALVPPFQSPDEPTHFVTFATFAAHSKLNESALALANKGHFERIRYRSGERFSALDCKYPDPNAQWASDIVAQDSSYRQPLVGSFFTQMAKFVGKLDAAKSLLILRIINALAFGLAVVFGTFLVTAPSSNPSPSPGQWSLALTLLSLPMLPFFAMHVSNYAFLTSIFVLNGYCLFLIIKQAELRTSTILVVGISVGLGILTSRTAISLIGFWVVIFAGKFIQNFANNKDHFTNRLRWIVATTCTFFGSIALTVASFTNKSHLTSFESGLHRLSTIVQPVTTNLLLAISLAAGCLVVLCIFVGLAAKLASGTMRYIRLAAFASIPIFVYVVGKGTLTAEFDLPNVELVAKDAVSLANYIYSTLKAFLFGFGFGKPSFYVVSSFWGNFGWLDTPMPVAILNVIKSQFAVGILVTIFMAGFARESRPFLWLLVGAAASTVYLVSLTAAAYLEPVNIHGRYLIGFYTMFAVISILGLESVFVRQQPLNQRRIIFLKCIVTALIHGFCLSLIICRYF